MTRRQFILTDRRLLVLTAVLLAIVICLAKLLPYALSTSGATANGNDKGHDVPTNLTKPTVTGTPVEGARLTGDPGTWENGLPQTTTLEWHRCSSPDTCIKIEGAEEETYVIQAADVSNRLRLRVTAENKNGTAEVDSAYTEIIAPAPKPPPAPSSSPTPAPSSSTSPSPTPEAVQTPTCGAGSWTAEYYANDVLAAPVVFARCEQAIAYDWKLGSPDTRVPNNNFSARWSGSFSFAEGTTTFTVVGDDGVRLWVNGALVLDKWQDQPTATFTATKSLAAGSYPVKLEYYEKTGDASARLSWTTSAATPAPSPTPTTPTCMSDQWKGEYFANVSLTSPATLTRCDAAVDFGWGYNSPAAGLPENLFSARWTRASAFPAGETTFTVTADDGIRLWVDGELVIDKWIDQAAATYTVTRTLTTGSHQLKIEYYERTGSAVARVSWSSTPSSSTTIPTSVGGLNFSGDWETGDVSQWSYGAQCANTGVSGDGRGTVNITTAPVSQARYSARFDLSSSGAPRACEVLRLRSLNVGTDDYYGMEIYLPSTWQEPPVSWGMAIAQFNFEGIWGSPVALNAHGDHIRLITQSGYCSSVNTSTPGCAYSNGIGGNVPPQSIVPRGALRTGQWIQMIVHARWTRDSSGVVEGWYRYRGDSNWVKTVTQTGYPTVQWSDTSPCGSQNCATVDKVGAYTGAGSTPVTIWHDNFRIGSGFGSVAEVMG
jgi:PA14 domain/Polysaccharide lyase